jgi:hypothetical protein
MDSLVNGLLHVDHIDPTPLGEARFIPGLQRQLRQELLRRRSQFLSSPVLGQVLAIAFDGEPHLDWIPFYDMPTRAIEVALKSTELGKARSISMCLSTSMGHRQQLLETLAQFDNLEQIILHVHPSIEETANNERLLQHFNSMPGSRNKKVVLTGVYSQALGEQLWLRSSHTLPQFPVLQIFTRCQTSGQRYLPYTSYVGDALIGSERFVAGLLVLFRAMIRNIAYCQVPNLVSVALASAPPSLLDFEQIEVGPLPVENYSVVPRRSAQKPEVAQEMSPMARDLFPGTWTVLISRDQEMVGAPGKTKIVPFLKYAFLKPNALVSASGYRSAWALDQLEVVGMSEFLDQTAPHVDISILQSHVSDLESLANELYSTLPSPSQRVSVLNREDALSMLDAFWDREIDIRRLLRQEMMLNPRGKTILGAHQGLAYIDS